MTTRNSWNGTAPGGPLVAWVGDDFTGSAAVLEVLTFAGLPSILFLEPPSPERLAQHRGAFGIGLATMARTRSPDWMRTHLPDLFRSLAGTGAGLVHYKVCTTLDSAPETGSIGCAMEVGQATLNGAAIPLLVAAPAMRRYQAFGHLFAAAGEEVVRIDRHPVMSRHPVTPISESDVAVHVSRQTDMEISLLDLEALRDRQAARSAMDGGGRRGWSLDQMGPAEETAAGDLIWSRRSVSPFVVGSQGVEYALVRHWIAEGLLDRIPPPAGIGPVDRMAVVSGSVSSTTAGQIAAASGAGFAAIRFEAAGVCGPSGQAAEDDAVAAARSALGEGRDPLIYTAAGPDDPAVARLREAAAGLEPAEVNDRIGAALGRILARLIAAEGLRRVAVSGGDTSGHVCRELGIFALSAVAPIIPGAGLNRAHADGALDGLEIALKGGQMGDADFFLAVKAGGGAADPGPDVA